MARGLRARKVFNAETAANGPDILSWIAEEMPMESKSAAKAAHSAEWWARNKSLYDDAAPLQRSHHNIIYGGKSRPDQVAQAAYEAGRLRFPDVNELWRAIRQGSNTRARVFATQRSQEAALQNEIKQHQDWLKASKEGELRVSADDLKVGDQFDVGDQRVKVTAIDPDTGEVTVEDGTKFGVQRLESGASIYVENYAEKLPSAELFAPEETPFNLTGEKAVSARPAPAGAERGKAVATTQFGAERLAQDELFAIQKIVADKDPEKSANAAQAMYGGAAKAIPIIERQLRVMDSDPETKRAFTKAQRAMLGNVLALLRQRSGPGRVAAMGGTPPSAAKAMEGRPSAARMAAETKPELVGLGAAVPSEFAQTSMTPTGIRNAVVDIERAKRGLPPAMQPARRAFGLVWDEAMARLDQDPAATEELLAELREQPRALSDVEDALLLQRQISLQNQYGKMTRELAQAYDDAKVFPERAADAEEIKLHVAKLSDDLLDLYNIGKEAGTETARGLSARRMMATEDYSLVQMELSKRAANEGNGLTDAQRDEVQKLHDKIAATQKAFDDYRAKAEAEQAGREASETVTALNQKVESETRNRGKGKVQAGAMLDEQGIVAGLKQARAEHRPLEELGDYIRKLAEAFIRQGIRERDPLIDAVHGVLTRQIDLAITRRETMDAISGYGDYKPLNPDAIKTRLRDLKGQMQQVAKLEDLEGKRPLQKTGLERRAPSDEERRLIKQVNEAKRKYGVVTTDPARQLKSALEADQNSVPQSDSGFAVPDFHAATHP